MDISKLCQQLRQTIKLHIPSNGVKYKNLITASYRFPHLNLINFYPVKSVNKVIVEIKQIVVPDFFALETKKKDPSHYKKGRMAKKTRYIIKIPSILLTLVNNNLECYVVGPKFKLTHSQNQSLNTLFKQEAIQLLF